MNFIGSATKTKPSISRRLFNEQDDEAQQPDSILQDRMFQLSGHIRKINQHLKELRDDLKSPNNFMQNFTKDNYDKMFNDIIMSSSASSMDGDTSKRDECLESISDRSQAQALLTKTKETMHFGCDFIEGYQTASTSYKEDLELCQIMLLSVDKEMIDFQKYFKEKMNADIKDIEAIVGCFDGEAPKKWSLANLKAALINSKFFRTHPQAFREFLGIKDYASLHGRAADELFALLQVLNFIDFRQNIFCQKNIEKAARELVITDIAIFNNNTRDLFCNTAFQPEVQRGLVGIYLGLDGVPKGFQMRKHRETKSVWNNVESRPASADVGAGTAATSNQPSDPTDSVQAYFSEDGKLFVSCLVNIRNHNQVRNMYECTFEDGSKKWIKKRHLYDNPPK